MWGLNQQEIQNGYDNAEKNPYVPDGSPGFFDNSLGVIPGALETAAAGLTIAAINSPGAMPTDQDFRSDLDNIIKASKPDPHVTGWLGNAMYGVGSVIPQAVLGSLVGGPVGAASVVYNAQTEQERAVLEGEGVDKATALTAARVAGATQALGVVAPVAIPGNILTRTASGAAINTIIGGTQRGITGKILESKGYKEMADQYKIMDSASIFTDMILGGFFGVLHSDGAHPEITKEPLPSEVDAALAANNIHQLEIESAPGIPADMATRNAHIAAMDTATEQMLKGESVDVSQHFTVEHPPIETASKSTPDSAFNGDTAYAMGNMFFSEHYNGEPIPLANMGMRPDEIIGLENDGLATDGKMSKEQFAKYELERTQRLNRGKKSNTNFLPKPDNADTKTAFVDAANEHGIVDWKEGLSERTQQHLDNPASWIIKNKDTGEIVFETFDKEKVDKLNTDKYEAVPIIEHLANLNKQTYRANASKARPREEAASRDSSGVQKGSDARENSPENAGREKLTKEIISENPDLKITDENGEVISAKDALAKADEEIAQAEKDKGLFDAAVNCFIRSGDA